MSNFQTWFNEKSEEAKEQLLGEYPRLLLEGKKYPELFKLLSNYYFIEAKINHPLFGVQALIEDYDLLDNSEIRNNSEYAETISSLTKIQGALRLSAHLINADSQQLPAQLTGRLLHFHTPEINNLLQQISTDQGLRCLTPSLTPPGSPLIRTLSGHSDYVNTVAITPDGKTVISGSDDKTIKIWDLETGTENFTLQGHSDLVNAIALTPDGKTVISGSNDNTIKIWDLATRKEIATFTGESYINCCAVAPDGVTIVAGESSGRLHFLRLQGKVTDE
jgi:WD40 repeat protein